MSEPEYVIITKELHDRLNAFVRTCAGNCRDCCHRYTVECHNCVAKWAKELLLDFKSNKVQFYNNKDFKQFDYNADSSLAAKKNYILNQIKTSRYPLSAIKIDFSPWDGPTAPGQKTYALSCLVKERVIGKRNGKYFYIKPQPKQPPKPPKKEPEDGIKIKVSQADGEQTQWSPA